MNSQWLEILSTISLCVGALCAVVIAADEVRHPQHMWIMKAVWPITALYAGPLALWAYYRYGRLVDIAGFITSDGDAKGKYIHDKKSDPRRLGPSPRFALNLTQKGHMATSQIANANSGICVERNDAVNHDSNREGKPQP